jgi:hypothetical protein
VRLFEDLLDNRYFILKTEDRPYESHRGHVGLKLCKQRLKDIHKQRLKMNIGSKLITDPDAHEHSNYIIEDLFRGKRIQTHIHNLRPFIFDPHHIDPIEIAQQNEQEFQVREIVAHQGNHRRRSTMEFQVRWTDYDMSSNS